MKVFTDFLCIMHSGHGHIFNFYFYYRVFFIVFDVDVILHRKSLKSKGIFHSSKKTLTSVYLHLHISAHAQEISLKVAQAAPSVPQACPI